MIWNNPGNDGWMLVRLFGVLPLVVTILQGAANYLIRIRQGLRENERGLDGEKEGRKSLYRRDRWVERESG